MSWRKSTRSYSGETCVEVSAGWRAASGSASGANCVEVASAIDVVWVRDSKDAGRGMLAVGGGAWRTFVAGICR